MSDALKDFLQDRRLFVLLGPYGTGKTEVAINLALLLRQMGRRTALCDLDIVNPYFRSREKEEMLEAAGVRLVAPPRFTSAGDLPAGPGELWAAIQDRTLTAVLDVGGDPAGARVLAAFAEPLNKSDPDVWYVLNRARMGGGTAAQAVEQLRLVEATCQVSITGLINNTHLLHETDADTLRQGAAFAEEVARLSGLPLLLQSVRDDLADQAEGPGDIFPLQLYMNRPWE